MGDFIPSLKVRQSSIAIDLSSTATTAIINNVDTTFISDITFPIDPPLTLANHQGFSISLIKFSIINCFYNIDDGENTVYLTYNSIPYNFTMTNGFYEITELITELDNNFASLGLDITTSYDSKTKKITFTSGSLTDFEILSTTDCLKQLGFNSGNHSSTSGVLTGDTFYNLSGIDVARIWTSITLENRNFDGSFNNYLEAIPIWGLFNTAITKDDNSSTKFHTTDKMINFVRIRFEDIYGNLLNFRNVPWFLRIRVDKVPLEPNSELN